jgi:arylsulfatase A-like enzyme
LRKNQPEYMGSFFPALGIDLEVNSEGGGDSGAPQVRHNAVARENYHTDWVADRAIDWLQGIGLDDDWFCWLSFPDPHHPWDPPASELHRVPWRDLDLPAGYPELASDREAAIDAKAAHWRHWYDGTLVTNFEAPPRWVPATLTADQVREVNAMAHIQNELIDEALGRVLGVLDADGRGDGTDVVFTTDHGEFQGDHGFLFKGPFHVDSLMRLPLVWRPAPDRTVQPSVVAEPVGLVDLAPTFCRIAGIEVPQWMDGEPLPTSPTEAAVQCRQRVLTEWDSVHPGGAEVHLQTITRDGLVCTRYEPGTCHDGTEGELWDLAEDPLQLVNLWDDPSRRSLRDDLVGDLVGSLPERPGTALALEAPV